MIKNDIKSVLIVGPNHPRKCGIASHTYQMYLTLTAKKVKVHTLAPYDCKADFNLNLIGFFNILKLLKFRNKYDLISLHFVPEEFFFTGFSLKRLLNIFPLLSFLIVFNKIKNLKVVIHEPPWTKYFFQTSFINRYIWKKIPLITFFTVTEKQKFEKRMKIKFKKNQVSIEDVSKDFNVFTNNSMTDSRKKLGIETDKKIFLCLGFIASTKGFDIVLDLFLKNYFNNSYLYIVGSVRLDNDVSSKSYLELMKLKSKSSKNIKIIDKYLSYEDFDNWIISSDYIIFPYREISNSGVLGRAKIFNKKVIVSRAGGLKDQIDSSDFIYEDDRNLFNILSDLDKT